MDVHPNENDVDLFGRRCRTARRCCHTPLLAFHPQSLNVDPNAAGKIEKAKGR
jgi:hypothetical protein